MPSATSLAASPSRSSTVTAAPARESLSAQARPIPLAAPVTSALCPVRSTLTDGPDVIETSFMSLLHLEETACPRQDLSPMRYRETSIQRRAEGFRLLHDELSALQQTTSPWRHEGLPPSGRSGTRGRPLLASSLRDELAFLGVGCGEVAPISLRGKDYRDHGDERHRRRVRRDRPPAEAGEQGGSNERRQAAGKDRGQLVAQRSSGVAHPGAEELGEVGCLRSVHRVVTEVHAEDDGDPDQRRNARVQQPEERESEEQREGGPEQVHRTTSYAVGERPEKGDGNEPDGGGDYDADQARALLHSQLSFYVGEHEDGQDVEGPVFGDAHPHREQDVLRVSAQHVQYWHGSLGAGLFDLPESRGLHDPQPDKEADSDEHDAEKERHAQAPRPGQHGGGAEVDQVGEQQTRRDPHLGPASEEASPALRSVLDRHQHGPAPLPADSDALTEAQDDEPDRSQDADGLVGRQQPYKERRDTHDEERQDQHCLASDPVPVVTEDYAAQRPRREANRVGRERQEHTRGLGELREEQRGEDQRRRRPV